MRKARTLAPLGTLFLLTFIAAWSAYRPTPPARVALTPPMGWNSWNHFGCNVSEALIRETADAMTASGMRDAGYKYVVIDDCWQVSRDASGTIVADPQRFPRGIKALADYVHSKGLKFGIYTDAGTKTCQGRPGTLGFEERDAQTYALASRLRQGRLVQCGWAQRACAVHQVPPRAGPDGSSDRAEHL